MKKFFKTFLTALVSILMVACTTPEPPKELDRTGTISLAEAISIARTISQNQGSELFIHNMNGQISSRDSHGNDPFPPRG